MTFAVGFFDGVHQGHQAILQGVDLVITFISHPLTVLAPERAPRLIMRMDERIAAIKSCGVKEIVALDFTPEFARMEPEAFIARMKLLAGGHSAGEPLRLRCGENWRFGREGRGNAALARAVGLEVEVVPYAKYAGEPISSTRIRKALEAGEMEAAAAMLGHPYAVSGAVFHGKGEGTKLGFPTINLRPGVYAAEVAGGPAIANFGTAPTFGARSWPEPVMEVHLLKYLREERRFASAAELGRQIETDVAQLRQALEAGEGKGNL